MRVSNSSANFTEIESYLSREYCQSEHRFEKNEKFAYSSTGQFESHHPVHSNVRYTRTYVRMYLGSMYVYFCEDVNDINMPYARAIPNRRCCVPIFSTRVLNFSIG